MTTETTQAISSMEDMLDVWDIIARLEDIEDAHEDDCKDGNCPDEDEHGEFEAIRELLNDLAGNGGDKKWNGAWYPLTLIRDSFFRDYAMELAEDIGAISTNASWPNSCIDWDKATRELQSDYGSVEFEGVTYWYR